MLLRGCCTDDSTTHEPTGTKDRAVALCRRLRPRYFMSPGRSYRQFWRCRLPSALLTGFIEGWSVGDAVYFTFVTGLTIGYGDIVPRQAIGRVSTPE